MTSIALQWVQTGEVWLFDCGEGTQHQILRAPVRLSRLTRVFLTHLHGDHLFGLPGLLATRSLIRSALTPVTVCGPDGIAAYLRCALEVSQTYLRFPLAIETVQPGLVCADETRQVVCQGLAHGAPSFGYAISENARTGQFDAAQAARLGVPAGPLYGRLKNGETIMLPDGRKIDGRELVGPPRPGRKLVICGDTGATPATMELARGADVLVHEATFLSSEAARAEASGHSTAAMAATAAREAGVRALILTHFSARYESEGGSRMSEMLAEAQAIFPNTFLAEDFWSYTV